MNSISISACILMGFGALACFVAGVWLGRRVRWIRRKVDVANRGPNADPFYETIVVNGLEYWFTNEQLHVAYQRGRMLYRSKE